MGWYEKSQVLLLKFLVLRKFNFTCTILLENTEKSLEGTEGRNTRVVTLEGTWEPPFFLSKLSWYNKQELMLGKMGTKFGKY